MTIADWNWLTELLDAAAFRQYKRQLPIVLSHNRMPRGFWQVRTVTYLRTVRVHGYRADNMYFSWYSTIKGWPNG